MTTEELFGTDNMVPLAEAFIDYQQKLRDCGAPTTVTCGFHYTKSHLFDNIHYDGLLTPKEKAKSNTTSNFRHAGSFGSGIYVGRNGYAFQNYGDVGILVAVLRGREQRVTTMWSTEAKETSDTLIGNKRHKWSALSAHSNRVPVYSPDGTVREYMNVVEAEKPEFYDELVLQKSAQCLPLFTFPSPSRGLEGMKKLEGVWNIHVELQKLLDMFFNESNKVFVPPYHPIDPCDAANTDLTKWRAEQKASREKAALNNSSDDDTVRRLQIPVRTTGSTEASATATNRFPMATTPLVSLRTIPTATATASSSLISSSVNLWNALTTTAAAATTTTTTTTTGTAASRAPLISTTTQNPIATQTPKPPLQTPKPPPQAPKPLQAPKPPRDKPPSLEVLYFTASSDLCRPQVRQAMKYASPEAMRRCNKICSICSCSEPLSVAFYQFACCDACFHHDCLLETIKTNGPRCPACDSLVDEPLGKSPSGQMQVVRIHAQCAGFSGVLGSIKITYKLLGGTQSRHHPQPGFPYPPLTCHAYLPDNAEGRDLLLRFKYAWKHGLTFTILPQGVVGWASIPHKTAVRGVSATHAFPDPSYMDDCNGALTRLGVPNAEDL